MMTTLRRWLRRCTPAMLFFLAACGGGGDGGADGGGTGGGGGGGSQAVAPSITGQPSAATVTAGATATFTVAATGTSPLTYQWRRNGNDIAGATAASYTTSVLVPADHGVQYSVVVSNGAGAVTSATATLTVMGAAASTVTGLHHEGSSTFVLTTDGTLYAKGSNASCRIGDSTNLDRANPVSLGGGWSRVAGTGTLFGIKSDGSLWGWGENANGVLGDGSTTARCEPRKVGDGFANVDGSGNAGGGGAGAVAVKLDGTLWAWGRLGNAGAGSLVPMQVGSDVDWAQAVSGDDYALALKRDGSLWTFGSNDYGQLGLGFTEILTFRAPSQVAGHYKAIAAGYNTSYAISATGGLFAWGWNVFGMLGDDTNTDRSVPTPVGTGYAAIDADTELVVALKDDGTVWAWGANRLGEVGDGTRIRRIAPVQIGASFASISTGGNGTIGIARDGSTWGWGLYDFDRDAPSGNFLFLSSPAPVRFDYFN